TINNTGNIAVASVGNTTDLRFGDGTHLTGGGTITLSDLANNRVFGAANNGAEGVTNVNNTIHGARSLGSGTNSFLLINQVGGVIDANSTISLVVAPTTNSTVTASNGGGLVNQGLMKATNSGGLVFNGGTVNNSGGTIAAIGTGNNVYLQNSAVIA